MRVLLRLLLLILLLLQWRRGLLLRLPLRLEQVQRLLRPLRLLLLHLLL